MSAQQGDTVVTDPLFIFATAAALGVAVILMVGIGGFAKGGEFNKKHANRIMRYRIIAQFVAVILIVAFAWLQSRG
jgi:Hypoxia induced protein conserved region